MAENEEVKRDKKGRVLKDQKRAGTRTRNWGMIVYPESAPDGWRDILRELHVPFLVSPLHDRDTHDDGSVKKPHWHVVMAFSSVKNAEQVKEITDKLNAPAPIKLESLQGYARYLIHKDDPDKAQYDGSKVEEYNGASFLEWINSATDTRRALMEIFNVIRSEDIRDYDILIDFLMDNGRIDLFIVATEVRTLAVTKYIDGRWKRLKAEEEKEEKARLKIDREKRLEAEKEWDYLTAIGDTINEAIKQALKENDNIPLFWAEMRAYIKGKLVDKGFASDALEEYCSKKGINLKRKYEEDTGIDVANGKTYEENPF